MRPIATRALAGYDGIPETTSEALLGEGSVKVLIRLSFLHWKRALFVELIVRLHVRPSLILGQGMVFQLLLRPALVRAGSSIGRNQLVQRNYSHSHRVMAMTLLELFKRCRVETTQRLLQQVDGWYTQHLHRSLPADPGLGPAGFASPRW